MADSIHKKENTKAKATRYKIQDTRYTYSACTVIAEVIILVIEEITTWSHLPKQRRKRTFYQNLCGALPACSVLTVSDEVLVHV